MPPRRWSGFPRHATAEERRARVEAAAARLGKHPGGADPVRIEGKAITRTFWGDAWCQNLQSYADLAYRLDRGRNSVRSGAVVDLKIAAGEVTARVAGTRLYQVRIGITAIAARHWQKLVRASTGWIGSLVGLLRGELPDEVLRVVTDREQGLFPKPVEMRMSCDCPDQASLCKHLAATLYGVGARLDDKPELLFVLRGVRAEDLVERAAAGLSATPGRSSSAAKLTGGVKQLGELFGIELVDAPVKAGRRTSSKPARTPGSTDQPTRTSPGPGGQTGKIPRTASRPRRS
jgi:uncharacterized Zn finger protein